MQSHNDVIQKLLRKGAQGDRASSTSRGNHDEFLRDYFGTHFGGVVVTEHATHVAADGRHYVVTHGDQFDRRIRRARRFAALGDPAQMLLRGANTAVNVVRGWLRLPGWSLSQWAKGKVKDVLNYVQAPLEAGALAGRSDYGGRPPGVICGSRPSSLDPRFSWPPATSIAVRPLGWRAAAPRSSISDGRLEIVSWKVDLPAASCPMQQSPSCAHAI